MSGVDGASLHDPKKMAAVIAAVQAFLEEEALSDRVHSARRLSRWKTATWQPFRGLSMGQTPRWKNSG